MPHDHEITLNGETLPILIRRHATSRRMVIRYQPLRRALSLTLPKRASLKQGLRFVEERRDWILEQIGRQSGSVPLTDGQVIPMLGRQYTLTHTGQLRGNIRAENERIYVSGDPAFMEKRVRDWLKRQLKTEIGLLAPDKARRIGKKPGAISLRDTTSRWGSCSSKGNLSFSWRLVFAPYEVMEYVVAHEVAHLKEMNHSADFWAVVEGLHPGWKAHRAWLRTKGSRLYGYG